MAQKYRVSRQDDTTNSVLQNARIEMGWGYIAGTTAQNSVAETITFQTAFTERPLVVACFGGDSLAGTTYGSGANTIEAGLMCKADTITTTNFQVRLYKPSGTLGANGNFFYQWIAIGN